MDNTVLQTLTEYLSLFQAFGTNRVVSPLHVLLEELMICQRKKDIIKKLENPHEHREACKI